MARNSRTLWILVAVTASLALRREASGSCSIPLEPTRTSFVAPVRIGGEGPFRFLFDTGTSMTVLNAPLAKRLGIAPLSSRQAVGTGGALSAGTATVDGFAIGPITTTLPVLIVDLPEFASHGRVDGIIGMDVLAGRAFRIDVRRRCVELDGETPANGARLESEEIVGRVAIKSDSMNFVLDSAASFAVLMSEPAQKLVKLDQSIDMTSASGRDRVDAGFIPRLRLGTLSLRDVPAAVSRQLDKREDALLPVRIFSSVYVDASRRFVILNGR